MYRVDFRFQLRCNFLCWYKKDHIFKAWNWYDVCRGLFSLSRHDLAPFRSKTSHRRGYVTRNLHEENFNRAEIHFMYKGWVYPSPFISHPTSFSVQTFLYLLYSYVQSVVSIVWIILQKAHALPPSLIHSSPTRRELAGWLCKEALINCAHAHEISYTLPSDYPFPKHYLPHPPMIFFFFPENQ